MKCQTRALAILVPDNLPAARPRLPMQPIVSWEHLGDLSGVERIWTSQPSIPAFDLALADPAPPAVQAQRVLDLAALLPILYSQRRNNRRSDRATRDRFRALPHDVLPEAFERGYPLIRAQPLQFPRDRDSEHIPTNSCWATSSC